MVFESNHIYHIYNQGNNRQKIFYRENNYVFFIEKIKKHILPYADVLVWCLMPNHFHLMVEVHTLSRSTTYSKNSNESKGLSRTTTSALSSTTFNKSIGILLTSYTRAINIQENKSGSLFRPHTKAICLTQQQGITPSFFNTNSGTILYQSIPEKEYPITCFNYIHNNPVAAGLVKHLADWPYSSFNEFLGLGGYGLANIQKAKEFGLMIEGVG